MNNKVVKEIIGWVITLVIALVVAVLVNKFVIVKVTSPTPSMENTFLVDETVVTNRMAYLFSDPKRGDIVVFPYPDDVTQDYIKRIIGLPGETVEGKDGIVYINGEPLTENYLKETPEGDFGPYTIPDGCYWMMGDNRNVSMDARDWDNKFVKKEDIKGKALFKYPNFKWFGRVRY